MCADKDLKEFKERVEIVNAKHSLDIQFLAKKVRTEFLIPICDKYKIKFISGMGIWAFEDKNKTMIVLGTQEEINLMDEVYIGLKKLHDILRIGVDLQNDLGNYVFDYPEGS